MEIKILKQEKNPYLKREEYLVEIVSKGNPVEKEIVEFIGKDVELTTIEKIISKFGDNRFEAEVFVYEDMPSKNEVQTIARKVKKKMEDERKKAEEEAKKKVEEEAPVETGEPKAAETAKEEVAKVEEVPAENVETPEKEKTDEAKVEDVKDGNKK